MRLLGRVNEALAEQRLLVRDNAAAGTPTPTFTTLAELYRSIGEEQAAAQHRDEAAWLRD